MGGKARIHRKTGVAMIPMLALIVAVLVPQGALATSAAPGVQTVRIGPARTFHLPPGSSSPPALSQATRAQLEAGLKRMNRHPTLGVGAPRANTAPSVPPTTTALKPFSAPRAVPQPSNPNAFSVFRTGFPPGQAITAPQGAPQNPSEVDEPSVSNNGNVVFYTGNWYDAESTDSGRTWGYVDPYAAFPSADHGFCCDQHTIYDPTTNITVWALLYSPQTTSQPNPGLNTLRLAVADGQAGLSAGTWHTYDILSSGFPDGQSGWIDYPQLAITSTYLYVTFNRFRGGASDPGCYSAGTICNQEDSIALRIPLATLAAAGSLTYQMTANVCSSADCVDTLTPVQQAGTVMYFAAHGGSTTLPRIRPPCGSMSGRMRPAPARCATMWPTRADSST